MPLAASRNVGYIIVPARTNARYSFVRTFRAAETAKKNGRKKNTLSPIAFRIAHVSPSLFNQPIVTNKARKPLSKPAPASAGKIGVNTPEIKSIVAETIPCF